MVGTPAVAAKLHCGAVWDVPAANGRHEWTERAESSPGELVWGLASRTLAPAQEAAMRHAALGQRLGIRRLRIQRARR